jgi:hypothetical protein
MRIHFGLWLGVIVLTLQLALAAPPKGASMHPLARLGHAALVERAATAIRTQHPTFDPATFDQVVVTANSSRVWVSFGHSIQFLPAGQSSFYGVGTDLDGMYSFSSEGDDPKVFYTPDADAKAAIAFVLAAIEKAPNIGGIPEGKLPPGERLNIRPAGDHYRVSMSSPSTASSYKVRLVDGTIFDASHKHRVPIPPGAIADPMRVVPAAK